jgi:uncharacterized protein YgfB (UPF0149 family)
MDDYYKYLGYLKKGLLLKTKTVVALFKDWNQAFFGSGTVSSKSTAADADFNSILDDMDNASQASDDEREPEA